MKKKKIVNMELIMELYTFDHFQPVNFLNEEK